jgi:hypothetical protein
VEKSAHLENQFPPIPIPILLLHVVNASMNELVTLFHPRFPISLTPMRVINWVHLFLSLSVLNLQQAAVYSARRNNEEKKGILFLPSNLFLL